MSDEINRAVAELLEAHERCMSVYALPGDETIKRIEQIDPEYAACVKEMDDPPTSTVDFWTGYCIFCVARLREKYGPVWAEVAKAYFRSDAHTGRPPGKHLAALIWAQIEEEF
ncbi:MAG: hypothetical protein ABIB93_08210 [Chloroflexota bacterium]